MVVVDDVHQPETGNDKLANLGPMFKTGWRLGVWFTTLFNDEDVSKNLVNRTTLWLDFLLQTWFILYTCDVSLGVSSP